MRLVAACLAALCTTAAAQWRMAEPGWKYDFPADHGNHRDFKTEWWYFTGNLRAADGREFGYQLTFFRQGIAREGDRIPLSRFVTRDIKFAHFTVSEVTGQKFHFFYPRYFCSCTNLLKTAKNSKRSTEATFFFIDCRKPFAV